MPPSLESVEQLALALSPEDRAQLAEILLESLQGPPLAEVQAAWDREIAARVAAYDRGEMQTYPAEEVFAEIRRRLR